MNALMEDYGTSTVTGVKTPYAVVMFALAGPMASTASIVDHPFSWCESATFSPSQLQHFHEASVPVAIGAKESVLEIKRLSGLTWEELGKMFGVTRRSVHNWARGEAVTADHEASIQAVLEKLRKIQLGSGQLTASRLRSHSGDGPLYSQLVSISLSALDKPSSEVPRIDRELVVDQATLMANWRPVAPFRNRWDDEPVGEVVPVGNYPVKRLKVATKRRG